MNGLPTCERPSSVSTPNIIDVTDGKNRAGTDAEELVANALRAHAARSSVPHDRPPPAEPADPQPDDESETEATSAVEPLAEPFATTVHTFPVDEATTGVEPVPGRDEADTGPEPRTRPNTERPVEPLDRMLAPHDVDSSLEIEAELGALQAPAKHQAPGPPATQLPIRWVLLLAVLLDLAAGAVAGLLTVL